MKTFLLKSHFLTIVFFIANLFFANVTFGQATVTTDKDDYAPGEYVIITGTGWQEGERVDFHFEETPKPVTCSNSHDNFAIADASGQIYYGGFLIKENHLGVAFVLTATGQTSGRVATAEFTDANVKFTTTGLPNNISVTVQYEGTAPGPIIVDTSVTFSTGGGGNGASSNIALIGSLSFQYPSTITVSGTTYALISTNPVSPTNVPSTGSYSINATYATCTLPTIGGQPGNQSITYGANATFSVAASGATGFVWQEFNSSWSPIANGGIYSGATTNTLTLTKPGVSLSGRKYRVVVTGSCGSVNSNLVTDAILTVNKKALTATSTVASKEYDNSPVAGSVSLGTVLGLVGTETLVITPSATNFADANAGVGKATTISYSLADGTNGGLAANYSMANFVTSGNITKAASTTVVTITGAPFTYSGLAQTPATVTVTGAGGLSLTPDAVYVNNTNAGTATASYSYGESANHLASSDSEDFTIGKAASTTVVTITGAPFTYSGLAQTPATVTVTGAGGLSLTPDAVYANNTNAGIATASYSYGESANHLASSDSEDFTIGKAASTTVVTITGAPFTYSGLAQTPATVTVTGAGGLSLTPDAVYANNTNAGTATASYSYGESANHLASSDSEDFTIGKAASTTVVTITGAPFTYSGLAQTPATVTVTGAGGLSLTPDAVYVNNTNAGTANASYSYGESANHLASSDSEDFTIGKAASTTVVTITGAPFTYSGLAQTPATITVTGAGGLSLTPDAVYVNNTNAGTATASYSYGESANHLASSDSEDFTIGKAASTTVVTITGAPFTYSGLAQTPATVTVIGAGGLSLTPDAVYANNTNAGTANASYSYGESANHLASSDSEDFTIGKAASTTVVTITGAPFTYSGLAQTPATVTVTGAGGLSLTPDAVYANNTNAGTANASYSYGESANHLASSDSEDFTIGKAASTTVVTITGAPFTYSGLAQTPATITVTGAGGLSLTPDAVYVNNTNAGTATASYSYGESANHLASSDSEDFTIGKAASTTVVTITGAPFTYSGLAQTPATVTVTGAGGLSLTPDAVYANNTNAGTANASYSYGESANHLASSDSEDFTIGKAASTTVVTITGAPFTYSGLAQTPATVTVTGAGGLSLTPDAVYANNTNAGTATASYSYGESANHLASSDSEDFTIGKAASTTVVTITGAPFTYSGLAQTPATVTVTGAGGLSLTPDAVYANNTNAGTATASYSYGESANHLASSDSEDFTIGKAASTTVVTITGAPFTYSGLAQTPATVTVTGVGGLSLTPDAVYANNTNAGTATASYSYGESANHLASSDSEDFTIGKAASTTVVTITGAPFTYSGLAQTPATVTVTGAGGLSLTPDAVYVNNTNAGTATASYSYGESANHLASSDSEDFTIGKAASTTVVTITGAPFTYSGLAQTPATVTVTGAGGLSLTPDAVYANNTNAGTANASYSYGESANHLASSDSEDFTIGKAASTTVVTITGAPFTYSGLAQTPATVTVTGAGGLSLTPDAVYVNNTNAGTATASYSYGESANHLASSDSEDFTIGKAAITVVNTNRQKVYGEVLTNGDYAGSITGVQAGDVITVIRSSIGSVATATVFGSTYPIIGQLVDPNGRLTNYTISNPDGELTVIRKIASVTPMVNSKYCGQIDPIFSGTLTGFLATDVVSATYSRNSGEAVGASPYVISALLSPAGVLSNYEITYNTANFIINGIISIDASASSNPIAVGLPATLSATINPPIGGVSVTFSLDNGNGVLLSYQATTNSAGVASTSVTSLPVEVYKVNVVAGSGCSFSIAYLPVYDPNGGFVTGGGWINSPVGAYIVDPTVTGKANFGFVSKYKKGSNVPEGNTEFQFQAGNLKFASSTYVSGSLVIAGSQAIYKGIGTINGSGSFNFMVSAVDGQINGGGGYDKFRIKIWNSSGVVYDNNIGLSDNSTPTDATKLGGGSIVIHEVKKNGASKVISVEETVEVLPFAITVYPNPSAQYFMIDIKGGTTEKTEVFVYDMLGRMIKHIQNNTNQEIKFGEEFSTGLYLAIIKQGDQQKAVKLIKQ
ncbi:T9SS type A sorting domain-containing protein [Flavobacterium sp. KS-LB2]|uniref:T9SS type A sorting domain-containing protein n=1 Tax=Flavobacterium sp. KS-LB2 TaxID=3120525 RepID=UPI0030CA8E68